ncbi:Protein of unknown function [Lutibacter oricola]|uniref:DUF3822 domain-containing protein n=1 Tax=Lutibacter oricola TaxID=762486 RepID=A0A1H2VU24_9FLAO|nr:DUF3822 family protein [Lutibacter oricola]SDW71434.1 Protein of unknown function [Lutibacter oricola]
MIKQTTWIKNNNLDFNNLNENTISIQLSLDGYSFCIYSPNQNEILALASYEFEYGSSKNPYQLLEFITELYTTEELLKPIYKKVIVTHFNNLVAQVPQALFNKNNIENYLQYNVKLLENDYITYDEINNTDIVNVYVPFVNINNFLIDTYGSFTFKHSSTSLIETLISSYKNSEGANCFVNVVNSNFEIVVLKNNKLVLFNSFNFKTKEDFLYYILFTAEQLELNPEEFNLVLMGDIEKESELYALAYQYIRNISFLNPTNFPSSLNNKIPKHAFNTVISNAITI